MVKLKCVVDGKWFEAKRRDAMYCSEACRKQAFRRGNRRGNRRGTADASDAGDAVPNQRTLVSDATLAALERAGKVEDALGQLALRLALRIDQGGDESGSAIAALSKELRATLGAATAGSSAPAGDPVDRSRDEVAAKRAQKRRGA